MNELRQNQMEALETLVSFNVKLVGSMKSLADELSGNRQPDTDDLMHSVMDAINWEVGVINGTMSLLNEGIERVDKNTFNSKIVALSEALSSKSDTDISAALRSLIPEFESLGITASDVIGK